MFSEALFNSTALSGGFVALGEGLTCSTKLLGKKYNSDFLKSLVSKIEATICPCCGTAGACANTIAEDVSATRGYIV